MFVLSCKGTRVLEVNGTHPPVTIVFNSSNNFCFGIPSRMDRSGQLAPLVVHQQGSQPALAGRESLRISGYGDRLPE